jgi:diguanylate cyclase (GGDEF)-like protein
MPSNTRYSRRTDLRAAIDLAMARPSPWPFVSDLEALYQADVGPVRRRRLAFTLVVVAAAILVALVGETPRTPAFILERLAWRGGAALILVTLAFAARWARGAWQEAALVTVAGLTGMGVVEILGERAPIAAAGAYMVSAVAIVAGIVASGQVRFSTAIVACVTCALAFPFVILAAPGVLPFAQNSGILIVNLLGFPLICLAGQRNEMARRSEYLHRLRYEIGQKELQTLNRELVTLSTTDPLTGLPNRRQFESEARRVWNDRKQAPFALALVDVDGFKAFNDAAGHSAGDRCLAAVADALTGALRDDSDRVARYGGEEFVVLFPGAGREVLADLGERLRAAVEAMGIPHPGLAGGVVTVSVGVTAQEGREGSLDRLLSAADALMYRAKSAGRNRAFSDTPWEEAAACRPPPRKSQAKG